MKPATILAIVIIAIVLPSAACYLSFKQGKAEGSDMTRQEYQNEVKLLEKTMDSLRADRQRLVDTSVAVLGEISNLNDKNDSLSGQLRGLKVQHNQLKEQYAKISHYDTINRGDIIRYVTDSLP